MEAGKGFDVAQMGSLIAMAYIDSSGSGGMGYVNFATGRLSQGSIDWISSSSVSANSNAIYSPSVAVGSNGIYWVGWIYQEGAGYNYRIRYARSSEPFTTPRSREWTVKVDESTDS